VRLKVFHHLVSQPICGTKMPAKRTYIILGVGQQQLDIQKWFVITLVAYSVCTVFASPGALIIPEMSKSVVISDFPQNIIMFYGEFYKSIRCQRRQAGWQVGRLAGFCAYLNRRSFQPVATILGILEQNKRGKRGKAETIQN
jgi:hypothetical protein